MTNSDELVEAVARAIDPNEHLATQLRYKRARAAIEASGYLTLKAENDALREALAPFASVAAINDQIASHLPDDTPCREFFPGIWPTLGDCRKARAAIEAYEQARAALSGSPEG